MKLLLCKLCVAWLAHAYMMTIAVSSASQGCRADKQLVVPYISSFDLPICHSLIAWLMFQGPTVNVKQFVSALLTYITNKPT